MRGRGPFILFDDARPGGAPGRLYRNPVGEVVAHAEAEVVPALERLRGEIAKGRHAAGILAYEAGFALDPALAGKAPEIAGPLLWFGLFDGYEPPPPIAGEGRTGPPRPRIARDDYLAAAARVREHLFAGDFYQANLTFGCDVTLLGDPLGAYARLRREALAGWGGVVRHPEGWILSLSPEQFFTLRGREVEAKPMKGTEPRSSDSAADLAAVEWLRTDPKQRAENLMIVDLLRNDLARIAETGSVEVPALFEVETFPTVHQMVSRVTARLRDGFDAIDVLRTIFPCGSITGAPKISAMLHLLELEAEPRGAYTGSMGWIEPPSDDGPGDAAFNVLIRSLDCREGQAAARLGLGAGLVVDSVAADEWAECLLKGEFVSRAADLPDFIETMRFDPEEGVVELTRHLARMQRSARELGFRFDHHAARNELQAATFGKKRPCMARLLLSPTGTMAIEVKPLDKSDKGPVAVRLCPLPVAAGDARLRHKTTDRGFYDAARTASGAFEVVFTDTGGFVTEGSFTTVFVERDGQLVTPPLARGVLPGVLREKLIDDGRAVEGELRADDLAGEFFIGNMLRGLVAARLASGG